MKCPFDPFLKYVFYDIVLLRTEYFFSNRNTNSCIRAYRLYSMNLELAYLVIESGVNKQPSETDKVIYNKMLDI